MINHHLLRKSKINLICIFIFSTGVGSIGSPPHSGSGTFTGPGSPTRTTFLHSPNNSGSGVFTPPPAAQSLEVYIFY